MIRKILIGLGVLFQASVGWGQYTAAAPFVAMSAQGRPLTGASITVTTSAGAPVTPFGTATGGVFTPTVSGSGIVQFFYTPGDFYVNVSGAGVTRSYFINIPEGADGLTPEDFGTGTGLLRRITSNTYGTVKVNYSALTAPTAGDDNVDGYSIGSMWIDILANNSYIASSVGAGNAIWTCLTCASGGIDPGTMAAQVPYWDGADFVTGQSLWTDGNRTAVGSGKLLDTLSAFQISQIAVGPFMLLWNNFGTITTNTILGLIGFGGLDSSTAPRYGATITGRGLALWTSGANDAPTSLDFSAQNGSGTGTRAMRIQSSRAIFGEAIPDGTTIHSSAIQTVGVEIYDATGVSSVSLTTPTGLDVVNRVMVLPVDNGTSGQALTTDGTDPITLSWESFAASIHAASHNVGGGDPVQYYATVEDEATPITQRTTINFTGAGVTCADSGGKSTCTIPNGGGGGIASLNADVSAAQTLAVGTTGTDFAIVDNLAGLHTFNLPNAGAAARGVVSTGTQTLAGAKTFSSAAVFSAATLSATFNEGVVVNESGTVNGDFRVESDSDANAIFVDASANAIGIFDSNPTLSGAVVSVKALAGKFGMNIEGVSNQDALRTLCLGTGDCLQADNYGSGAAIKGTGNSTVSKAGLFQRNIASTSVPIVQIDQQNAVDSQPILSILNTGGAGSAFLDLGNGEFLISSTIQLLGSLLNDYNLPIYSFISDNSTGFGTKITGQPTIADNGELIVYGDAITDTFVIAKRLISEPGGVSSTDGIVEVQNGGQGQGVYGIATGSGVDSVGVEGETTADLPAAVAAYFHTIRGTAVNAEQVGAASASSVAAVIKARRHPTMSGGAVMTGPIILGIDDVAGVGSTGYLVDLQKPASTSKFHVDKDGELFFTGVNADGTGKVLCVKSDQNIGTCSTVVGAGGTCTCG